jgi:dephospho-CoA kinase
MMSFKYAIALTGSIATGKSSVATIFKSYGFNIIDADMVAHKVLDDNYIKISDIFGKEYVLDNRVDRKRLGTLIFSNKDAKKRLENLLHPLIFKEIERLSIERDRLQKVYIIDIPLFFETNRYPISKVIVVYTPKEIQLQRLIDRDKLSKEEALKRINSQIDIEEKKIRATYLIDNSKDLKFLQQECDRVKREILNY